MAEVGFVSCESYSDVKEKILASFRLAGGIETIVKRADHVLLKPNLLAAPKNDLDPVITDKRFIVAVSELLIDHGAKVSIGDSPAFGTVESILKKVGVADHLKRLGVKLVEFNRPGDKMKAFTIDKALLECDQLINLPKLKVHCQLRATLSIKNLYGTITGKRKALLHLIHGDKENHFAELILKIYDTIRPSFTLIDAVEAMEKKGPRGGIIKNVGWIASGKDCVAIDRVMVDALGINPDEYRILNAAKTLNIGQWDLDQIKILGESKIPRIELEFPQLIPISFSPVQVIKSTIKNAMIKKKQKSLSK